MISLDSPIWKELGSAGSDTDEILRDLMEGKGDFRENMEELSWDLSHQASYYDMTAYALPHLAVLCAKLSLEDKAFLIKDIGLAIAAEGAWPLEPDTEDFREFQERLARGSYLFSHRQGLFQHGTGFDCSMGRQVHRGRACVVSGPASPDRR